jgi:hypothetical protein
MMEEPMLAKEILKKHFLYENNAKYPKNAEK